MKIFDLSGKWNFSLNDDALDDSITLPATTAQAKKGEYNESRETGYLTESYPFEGTAWFSRTVSIEEGELGQTVKLFLERTRITSVYVDGEQVSGEYSENEDSLCAPHIYNLTEYISNPEFELKIAVANTGYKTKGGHMTSPDTQTNWNGITGRIELIISGNEELESISVKTLDMQGNVELMTEWNSPADTDETLTLKFKLYEQRLVDGKLSECAFLPEQEIEERTLVLGNGKKFAEMKLSLGKNAVYWDEYNPVVYRIEVLGRDDTLYGEAVFGLRIWDRDDRRLYINGHPVFLRGKHDGCLFPLTGACPTDLEEWLRVMGIAKEYGINHYRYHTSCPPEEAFHAADLLGIYVEPELPFWGTIAAPGEEGYNEAEQEYLITEGFRILKAFGNHPSFCFMSLGNELWGSSARLAEIIRKFRDFDDRHLYTQGSNNFQFVPCILPEDDFYVGVRFAVGELIRGSYAMCDAPQGFVQTEKPNTVHSYDDVFVPYLAGASSEGADADEEIEIQYGTGTKKVKATDASGFKLTRPVVNHEIGQYCTFPDFKETKKYTGVLRAESFNVFKERMEAAGLDDLAPDYFLASGKLAANCYKLELEAAHKSKYLSGYQILDIQDFSGQGTSLVGILDAFMDNKGIISKDDWKSFCSDMVIMAEIKDFVLMEGEKFEPGILLSCYRPDVVENKSIVDVTWKLYESSSQTIDFAEIDKVLSMKGTCQAIVLDYGVTEVGKLSIDIPEGEGARKWTLVLEINGSEYSNSYELTVLPKTEPEDIKAITSEEIYITSNPKAVFDSARVGKKTILFTKDSKDSIPGTYCTEFWNYPMFKGISEWLKRPLPVGTYGLLINPDHPALSLLPTENYSTPLWYELITDAGLTVLDKHKELRPIVRMMDNFERNHSLGFLWECTVDGSPVLICAQSYEKLAATNEGRNFLKSICCYASTELFKPQTQLTAQEFEELF